MGSNGFKGVQWGPMGTGFNRESIKNQSKTNKVSDAIAKLTCDQHEGFGAVGGMSWKASKKLY